MGELGPFLVPMTLFVSIAAVAVLRGPLGKALGERIAGRGREAERPADTASLRGEVEELRWRVTELEERLDFTERVLAQQKERAQLPREG